MITRKQERTVTEREHMRGGAGTVRLEGLVSHLPANARLFSEITLVPGASIGYHVHEKETELFFFAKGKGLANDNGTVVSVEAGDAMSTPDGCGHSVENNSDSDLVIIAAIIKDPAD